MNKGFVVKTILDKVSWIEPPGEIKSKKVGSYASMTLLIEP